MNFANSKTLVGVATDRGARDACLRSFSCFFRVIFFFRFFSFYFPVFLQAQKKRRRKIKSKINQKIQRMKKREASEGCPSSPETAHRNVTRNRAAI